MKTTWLVFCGGAFGSAMRYLMSRWVRSWAHEGFPWGVLAVNVIGCFLMGVLSVVLVNKLSFSGPWRAALMVGFLGGLTTFSSFSLEVVQFLNQGRLIYASVHIFITVLGCLMATLLGQLLAKIYL